MNPIDFPVKRWTYKCSEHSISWEPFTWRTLNLVHCYFPKNQWPLLILRSISQRSSQIGHRNILNTQYLENHLLYRLQSCQLVHCDSYWFWCQKIKGQTGHCDILTTQYLGNPLLERHQTWVLWYILMSQWPLWISRSKSQGWMLLYM
jgi:hypothetical protein